MGTRRFARFADTLAVLKAACKRKVCVCVFRWLTLRSRTGSLLKLNLNAGVCGMICGEFCTGERWPVPYEQQTERPDCDEGVLLLRQLAADLSGVHCSITLQVKGATVPVGSYVALPVCEDYSWGLAGVAGCWKVSINISSSSFFKQWHRVKHGECFGSWIIQKAHG